MEEGREGGRKGGRKEGWRRSKAAGHHLWPNEPSFDPKPFSVVSDGSRFGHNGDGSFCVRIVWEADPSARLIVRILDSFSVAPILYDL